MLNQIIYFQQFCDNFLSVATVRREARRRHWNRTFGLGVAGNVAGHMAQAGEAEADASPQGTPEALFTFYAPHPHTVDATEDEILSLLSTFPVTNATIELPRNIREAGDLQVEPELGLYCDIVYSREGDRVERLVPRRVAAFNDCSIRKLDTAQKLSEKKNWGFASKGISIKSFRIDSMSQGSLVDKLVLTSYIKRGDQVYKYSVDAPARNYLLFHDALMEWIVDRINTQENTGKWLPIFSELVKSDYPTSMWIALGAGEYTEWGAKNFLELKDQCLVLVYREDKYPDGPSPELIEALMDDGPTPEHIISLHQTFV
jgi:hypothetical protein